MGGKMKTITWEILFEDSRVKNGRLIQSEIRMSTKSYMWKFCCWPVKIFGNCQLCYPLKVPVTIFEKLTHKIFSVPVKISPEKSVTRGMKVNIWKFSRRDFSNVAFFTEKRLIAFLTNRRRHRHRRFQKSWRSPPPPPPPIKIHTATAAANLTDFENRYRHRHRR